MEGEYCRIDSRGNEIWIRGSYTPVRGARGDVVRILKFAYDITAAITGEYVGLRRDTGRAAPRGGPWPERGIGRAGLRSGEEQTVSFCPCHPTIRG